MNMGILLIFSPGTQGESTKKMDTYKRRDRASACDTLLSTSIHRQGEPRRLNRL